MKTTKEQLLAFIDSRVLRRISVTLNADDTVKIDAGVNPYVVNVMQLKTDGGTEVVNLIMYVIDEGTENEVAYLADPSRLAVDTTLRDMAITYLATLTQFERVKVQEINANEQYLVVTAFEKEAGTDGVVDQLELLVYVDSNGNPAHKVIKTVTT